MPNIQRSSDAHPSTGSHFHYVRIGSHGKKNRYLCLEQKPLVLLWLLYWYGRPFGVRGKGIRKTVRNLTNILYWVRELVHQQRRSPHSELVIELPAFGHLCLQVHNGYKLFDFRRSVVMKLFSPDIKMARVRREINRVQRAGAHEFAPAVHRWNLGERFYEEEYVNGGSAGRSSRVDFLHTLQNILSPLLERMILARPPREVNALEYACELREKILRRESGLAKNRLDPDKLCAICEFVEAIVDRLRMRPDRLIYLVLSHGDFGPRHVLISANKAVIVDWECSRHRSLFFDLYDYSFRKFRTWGASSGIAQALDAAISGLRSGLTLHDSADRYSMLSSVEAIETYRLIYYMEYVGLHMVESANVTQRTLEKILSMTDVYHNYESTLTNGRDFCPTVPGTASATTSDEGSAH